MVQTPARPTAAGGPGAGRAAAAAGAPAAVPPGATAEHPASVVWLSGQLSGWIDRLGAIWIDAQIAQLTVRARTPYSLAFLTLRDTQADVSVSASVPYGVLSTVTPPLQDGDRVVVHGKLAWFDRRGQVSLRVDDIRRAGVGDLHARLEALKQQLQSEGLFDPARKRPLPTLPNRIGLITGRNSDAQKDVERNVLGRWPQAHFEIRNVAVQGEAAAGQVIAALRDLDADPAVDVIIIARGGGAFEDLLPFSDEALVRAVAAAHTPVVSAIGHEADCPLLDFVADLRASTPTDAAKRVVPDVAEELRRTQDLRARARAAVAMQIDQYRADLAQLRSRPALRDPASAFIAPEAERLTTARRALRLAFAARLDVEAADLAGLRSQVTALSPQATLDRGYAVALRPDGSVAADATTLQAGDALHLLLRSGSADVTVTATSPNH